MHNCSCLCSNFCFKMLFIAFSKCAPCVTCVIFIAVNAFDFSNSKCLWSKFECVCLDWVKTTLDRTQPTPHLLLSTVLITSALCDSLCMPLPLIVTEPLQSDSSPKYVVPKVSRRIYKQVIFDYLINEFPFSKFRKERWRLVIISVLWR